jgi:hypothetical protein
MFNSIKKNVKAVWNRNKHRGNDAISKAAAHQVETMLTNDSDNVRSPPSTKRGEIHTLEELFRGDDFPSPPSGGEDLPVTEVHEELRIVYPNYAQLKDSDDPFENEKYMKLAYAVGKKFFGHLLSDPSLSRLLFAFETAERIIDKDTPEGKRFHVMYSAYDQDDRMWTLEENQRSPHPIREYEYYVKQSLLPYISDFRANDPDRVYEVFLDNAHENMEPFYRTQNQGNCFAHAAIVLHFYLQLFYREDLTASLAYLVNLSRFIRNMYTGIQLFDYIVFNKGNTFQSVLDKLMPHAGLMPEHGDLRFEAYVTKLKQYGPAVVSMSVGPDFFDNRWHYEGTRPAYNKKDLQGHGMLLVGIVKSGRDIDMVEGKDVHFILQNFWEDKQFVMVRRDYFRQCTLEEGKTPASFHWVTSQPPCFAEPESIYAGLAGATRVSLSSDLLERPIDRELFG